MATIDNLTIFTPTCTFSGVPGEIWTNNEPFCAPYDPTMGHPQQNKMDDYVDMMARNFVCYE